MKRTERASLAKQTLDILNKGFYMAPGSGDRVGLADEMAQAIAGTTLHTPDGLDDLLSRVLATDAPYDTPATLELAVETTLEAIVRVAAQEPGASVMALNFASAKNPGGGFLGGSQAQEESLARSSGLYPTLKSQPGYYTFHRALRTALYSDHMIHSPQVPVIRDDQGGLLESPVQVSFITAAAVNAGVVRRRDKSEARKIREVMVTRAAKMMALAAEKGHDVLILGAWGCGVFRNDPQEIASVFGEVLGAGYGMEMCFRRVIFAIPKFGKKDHNAETFAKGLALQVPT